MAHEQQLPISLKLATGRDDGGHTANYTVYEGGGVTSMKNGRGETVTKNTLMGGNGSIYIAKDLAGQHTEWVLMPRAMFDQVRGAVAAQNKAKVPPFAPTKKGKK